MMHPRGEFCVVGMNMIRVSFNNLHPIVIFFDLGCIWLRMIVDIMHPIAEF